MEIKLKSGRNLKVKNISVDDRDMLLDTLDYEYDSEGSMRGVKMMHSTMTKWMRACLNEKTDDKFLMGFSLEEKN